jgi:hypothetical protein
MLKPTRFLLFSLVLLANPFQSEAQTTGYIYADALTVYNAMQAGGDAKSAVNILAYYFNDPQIATNYANDIATNPFLNKYKSDFDALFSQKFANVNAKPTAAGGVQSTFNQANIIEGVAQFLISRGEEELSMAFFSRFQADLKKYPEVACLFPNTISLINNVQNSNLLNLLQQLKDAFMKDLLNLPSNILALRTYACTYTGKDSNKVCQGLKDIQTKLTSGDFAVPVAVLMNIAQAMINGDNIVTGLNKGMVDPIVCAKNDNLTGYIKLAAILTNSLRDNNPKGGIFVADNDLGKLFGTDKLLNIFLGFIYQKYNTDACYQNLSISVKGTAHALTEMLTKISTGTVAFQSILSDLSKVNTAFSTIKQTLQNGKTADAAVYGTFVQASLTFIQNTIKTVAGYLGDNISPTSTLGKVLGDINTASNLCIDIQQKNYAGIFNDAIKFIQDNQLLGDDASQKIVTYLSFAANLASATTPTEVKNALETVALPPGSYSVKQKSSINISLNGYIGYNWDLKYGHGIYAPIGFATSFGLSTNYGGAFTLFVSIIDLGGVAAYQLANTNTSEVKQDITFESVIAPGIQGYIEIPKWPIAVGGGWRMTPKLFYSGDITVAPKSVGNISILIDIPIFTIFNRPFR